MPRPVLRFARLVPRHLLLIAGTSARLQVVGQYSDGINLAIVGETDWVSSDGAVATVDNVGKLTAVAPGIAEIRAQLDTFEVRSSQVAEERGPTERKRGRTGLQLERVR